MSIGFDGFADARRKTVLGEAEGNGFKQLMTTFESGPHSDRGAGDWRVAQCCPGTGAFAMPKTASPIRQSNF